MWTHLTDTAPVARKDHKCYLCGLLITKGTKYLVRTGVNSGDGIFRFRMHYECESATVAWEDENWEGHDEQEFRRELKSFLEAEMEVL